MEDTRQSPRNCGDCTRGGKLPLDRLRYALPRSDCPARSLLLDCTHMEQPELTLSPTASAVLCMMFETCRGDLKCRPELSILVASAGLPKLDVNAAIAELAFAKLIVVTRRTFALTQTGIQRAKVELEKRRKPDHGA